MNILIVGDYWKGSCAWYYEKHLKSSKNNINIFNYRKSFLPFDSHSIANRGFRYLFKNQFTALMNNHLLKEVKKTKPDFVLVVKGETILPSTIDAIKAENIKIANWFIDPVTTFNDRNTLLSAPHYDLFFAKDRSVVNTLKVAGFDNGRYLPEGYDEASYYPVKPKKEFMHDVSLVGYHYDYRLMASNNLSDFDFRLWGKVSGDIKEYPKLISKADNRFLTVEEKNLAYNSSKISYNVHHPAEISSINVRAFEICGAGGFQLVDYKPEIEEFYKPGKDIATYSDTKELREKVNYYLDNEEERIKIAKAGYKRATQDHKISDRLKTLIGEIKKL